MFISCLGGLATSTLLLNNGSDKKVQRLCFRPVDQQIWMESMQVEACDTIRMVTYGILCSCCRHLSRWCGLLFIGKSNLKETPLFRAGGEETNLLSLCCPWWAFYWGFCSQGFKFKIHSIHDLISDPFLRILKNSQASMERGDTVFKCTKPFKCSYPHANSILASRCNTYLIGAKSCDVKVAEARKGSWSSFFRYCGGIRARSQGYSVESGNMTL